MASKKPTIAITGAHGFLGSALVQHFADSGWNVLALVREVPSAPKTPNVRFMKYDLRYDLDPTVLEDVDYLIHAAFVKYSNKNPEALKDNINGAKKLLAVSRASKLKKNIFISSMSSHEDAISVYGKQKLAIESLFNTKEDVIVRAGLIVGNGGLVHQMYSFMKSKHILPLVGGGKQPLQVIGVYDLVNIIEKLLEPKFYGLYTVANPRIYTYKEFYRTLAKSKNIAVVFVPVPFWVLISTIRLIHALHLPLDISEDNALGLKQLRSVDNKKDMQKIDVETDDLRTVIDKMDIKV
jgi:nucleoside-diphosphate-sugar epimerase